MDENDIPAALRGTFRQIREDFTLTLESDAHDLAVGRGLIREHVGEMPIADPGAKKEIMRELLHDPKYIGKALDALLRSCESKGLNPVDCQVLADGLCTLIVDGKIQLPF